MTEQKGNPTRTASADRVRQIVDAYGADPARWPQKDRAALNAGVDAAPELDPSLAHARQLDTLLDRLPAEKPSAGLIGRIMAATTGARAAGAPAAAARQGFSVIEWLSGLWPWEPPLRPSLRPIAALAFSALVGIALASIVYWPTADHGDGPETTRELPLVQAGIRELAEDENAGESQSALVLVFDPADIDGAPMYSNTYENAWELAFDPTGIELAGFTMNGR